MASKDESKSTPKESVQTSKLEASAEHKPKQKNKRKRKKSCFSLVSGVWKLLLDNMCLRYDFDLKLSTNVPY